MKNLINSSLALFCVFTLVSCKIDTKDKKSTEPALKASCDIQDITLSQLECIEFYPDFTGNSEDLCEEAQDRHFGSLKSHRDSRKATTCVKYKSVGSCKLTDYTVFFYEKVYSAGGAQTECNSMGGNFIQ